MFNECIFMFMYIYCRLEIESLNFIECGLIVRGNMSETDIKGVSDGGKLYTFIDLFSTAKLPTKQVICEFCKSWIAD